MRFDFNLYLVLTIIAAYLNWINSKRQYGWAGCFSEWMSGGMVVETQARQILYAH